MAAPSGPIQVLPAGLLGLLQLKNSGNNPDTLLGTVQPSVEMLDFWLNTNGYTNNPQIGVIATPSNVGYQPYLDLLTTAPVAVPQHEWWYIHSINIQFGLDYGEEAHSVRGVIMVGPGGVPIARQMLVTEALTIQNLSTATADVQYHLKEVRPFWAPPGAVFGLQVGRSDSTLPSYIQIMRTAMPV